MILSAHEFMCTFILLYIGYDLYFEIHNLLNKLESFHSAQLIYG